MALHSAPLTRARAAGFFALYGVYTSRYARRRGCSGCKLVVGNRPNYIFD